MWREFDDDLCGGRQTYNGFRAICADDVMSLQNVTVLEDNVGIVGVCVVHLKVDDFDGADYGDSLFFAMLI